MNRTRSLTLLSLLSLTALAQEQKVDEAPPKEGATTSTKKGEGKKKEKPAEEKKDEAPPTPKPAQ